MGVGPFLGLPPAEESHVINILILAFTHIYIEVKQFQAFSRFKT